MLINVLRDEQPTHIAVAFDVSRQTFRLRASTPSTRPTATTTPDEFTGQVAADQRGARRAADPDRSSATGYEADDVIATLAAAGAGRRASRC